MEASHWLGGGHRKLGVALSVPKFMYTNIGLSNNNKMILSNTTRIKLTPSVVWCVLIFILLIIWQFHTASEN